MAMTAANSELIVRNPRIHGGEPVLRGTRVPVRSVVLSLAHFGGDQVKVAEAFRVEVAAIRAALAYYDAHRDEVERIIDKHERAAMGE